MNFLARYSPDLGEVNGINIIKESFQNWSERVRNTVCPSCKWDAFLKTLEKEDRLYHNVSIPPPQIQVNHVQVPIPITDLKYEGISIPANEVELQHTQQRMWFFHRPRNVIIALYDHMGGSILNLTHGNLCIPDESKDKWIQRVNTYFQFNPPFQLCCDMDEWNEVAESTTPSDPNPLNIPFQGELQSTAGSEPIELWQRRGLTWVWDCNQCKLLGNHANNEGRVFIAGEILVNSNETLDAWLSRLNNAHRLNPIVKLP